MNILVINGSPKGDYSITLQTCKFLEIKFPDHNFLYLNVGQQICSLEKDFSAAKTLLEKADLIIFSYPVYTFIAPYQLHRFIELIKSNSVSLAGKWATQITTSKHFYDITAHRFVEQNCQDMGLYCVRGLSSDMDDLIKPDGQTQAVKFFKYVLWCFDNNYCEKHFEPIQQKVTEAATLPDYSTEKHPGRIAVVTDMKNDETNLKLMIERFSSVSCRKIDIFNINDFNMKGGCLGCFKCAVNGKCVYKDGFSEILRENIQSADAIVYAFTIKDHSMGSLFKMYDDRQFCNGHRNVTMGMPVGYIISGQYSSEYNLRMIIEGRSEVGGNFLAGVATDECDTDFEIDKLAETMEYAIAKEYSQPSNFLGIGGMKIFRDLVFGMRGMMRADHKFYKEHKLYDFPHKNRFKIFAMYLVGALLGNDKIASKIGNKINEGMLMPYKEVLEQEETEDFDEDF